MRIPRIYYPDLQRSEDIVILEHQAARHLVRVLRLKEGDEVILFNGHNQQCHAKIASTKSGQATLTTQELKTVSRESTLDITLIQGISRSEKMDWTLQKATELGVKRIIPVYTRRGVVKLDNNRRASRIHHWKNIIIHACEQSGRNLLPILEPPLKLDDAIALCVECNLYYLDPTAKLAVKQLQNMHTRTGLIIGPEGGFDQSEIEMMKDSSIEGLKLGPRILRTETAGIAALAAIGALFGDL